MARSRWKLSNFSDIVLRYISIIKNKKHKFLKKIKKKPIYLYSRSSIIPRCFKKFRVLIHKGNSFRRLRIRLYRNIYKFGEFSFTRKLYYYPLKKKYRR